MATTNTSDSRAGQLTVVDNPDNSLTFHFELQKGITNLAPNVLRRSYTSQYATSGVALSALQPREFRANSATDIAIEFDIVGDMQTGVEPSLKTLRGFMKKDRRTGEPPDIAFLLGDKSWTVRIDHMEFVPRLWNKNADEQRVRVVLTMHTIDEEN